MNSISLEADGFSFTFLDALNAFVFDEKDHDSPNFHGVPMKAVDIVVEFQDFYLFVEIKDFDNLDLYDIDKFHDETELKNKQDAFKWLKNYLKYKFRDTFLFRFAENKVDKPVKYICLLANWENALCQHLGKSLKAELPTGKASKRWTRELAEDCFVVNLARWNRIFEQWPVRKLV